MVCPNCGTKLDENANECFLCGYHICDSCKPGFEETSSEIDGGGRSCPICGITLTEEDAVCPICGTYAQTASMTPAATVMEGKTAIDPDNRQKTECRPGSKGKESKKKRASFVLLISLALISVLLGSAALWRLQKWTKESGTPAVASPSEQLPVMDSVAAPPPAEVSPSPSATPSDQYSDEKIDDAQTSPPEAEVSPSPSTDPSGGYSEADISYVQAALIELGYSNVMVTGRFDSVTQNALMSFQEYNEMTVDGCLSLSVMQELQNALTELRWEQQISAEETPPMEFSPYLIQIQCSNLGIYEGPGYGYDLIGSITDRGLYTIVDEAWEVTQDGYARYWGKLKSGAGWIDLNAAQMPDDETAEPSI